MNKHFLAINLLLIIFVLDFGPKTISCHFSVVKIKIHKPKYEKPQKNITGDAADNAYKWLH